MISVLFYGTPEIAAISLRALLEAPGIAVKGVVTQPDRPTGRKQILTPSPVKELASHSGIPVLQPERIKKNEAAFIREVSTLGDIDIAIVVAFGQILPKSALDLPRCGSLNLHASLLPRWRGAAPIQRAIMAGDSETGVCLMKMDIGLDTGAVFSYKKIPITATETAGTLHDAIARTGAALIVDTLPAIVSGKLSATPQADEGVTYAEKITDKDSIINWQRSAEQIACQIRGLAPSPGAYSRLEGKRLKIFECRANTAPVGNFVPGQVCLSSNRSFSVACGSGSLEAFEVQIEGKKRTNCEEFLRGTAMPIGTDLA